MAMIFGRTLSSDGTEYVYLWLQTALLAGATVTASGDGLAAYSAVGNVITSSGAGAGGLGNTGAWFVLSWGTECWCVQRGTNARVWRITVSPSGTYTGGSSTICQSAPDEFPLVGDGTPLAPTYTILFPTATACTAVVGVDNAVPRRAYLLVWVTATVAARTYLFRDIVTPADPTDANLAVRGWGYDSTTITVSSWGNAGGSPTGPNGYHPAFPPSTSAPMTGTQASVGQSTPGYIGGGAYAFPGNTGTLSISGADPLVAPFYARWNGSGTPFLKGFSTLFLTPGPTRATGSTIDVAVANDRVVFAANSLPWNGTIP